MSILNVADQALIVDILIKTAKETTCRYTAKEYLKLIKKVKSLETEVIPVKDEGYISLQDIFKEMDDLKS